jgi:hypothetical protein
MLKGELWRKGYIKGIRAEYDVTCKKYNTEPLKYTQFWPNKNPSAAVESLRYCKYY